LEPAVPQLEDRAMRSTEVFRTRSYQMQPLGTLGRGAEWILRSWLGSATSYPIDFGPYTFRLELQSVKRGFGSAGIFIQRRYYEPLLEFGYKLLNKGAYAIDGGANQGIFSCAFAAAVGVTGHIYAVEPQTYAVGCIRRNAHLNSITNLTVFEGALSDVTGETYLDTDGGRGPVSAFTTSRPQGNETPVKALAIDDIAAAGMMHDVQLIKLDVEGAELKALHGAGSMIQRTKPQICVEAWDKKLYRQIEEFLGRFGYGAYVFDGRGQLNAFSAFYPSPNVFFMR
jgi:FkbM family methyltransferase